MKFDLEIEENVALDAIRGLELAAEEPASIINKLGIKKTPISLEFNSPMSQEAWESYGQELKRSAGGVSWYIGDWLNYGKNHFTNRYQLMVASTHLKKHNLETIASVANKFPPDRRRSSLTFGHHARVVALTPQEQDTFLSLAEANRWSTAKLRAVVGRYKDTGDISGPIVGELLVPAFRGLLFEPINEQGVVFLFGLVAKDLGYLVEVVQSGFPDCIAKRKIKPGRWQQVRIEFEFESRNFSIHKHSADACDMIICWRHNWPDCPVSLEVVELETSLKALSASDKAKTS